MKILNVNMSLDPVSGGGTAERTLQISRSLTRAGLQCDVLTINLNLSDERIEQLNGINLIALECLIKRYYIPKLSQRIIKDTVANADIIHLMIIGRYLTHWYIFQPEDKTNHMSFVLPVHYHCLADHRNLNTCITSSSAII